MNKFFSNKFEHTVETGLKNDTTGQNFVEYSQGVVQKYLEKKSWLCPQTPTNEKYEPSTCRVYLV